MLKLSQNELQHGSREHGNCKQYDSNANALAFIKVGAEQHQKSDAGAGRKTRHGRTEAYSAFRIKLRKHNGGCAVGNKPDKPGNAALKNLYLFI